MIKITARSLKIGFWYNNHVTGLIIKRVVLTYKILGLYLYMEEMAKVEAINNLKNIIRANTKIVQNPGENKNNKNVNSTTNKIVSNQVAKSSKTSRTGAPKLDLFA